MNRNSLRSEPPLRRSKIAPSWRRVQPPARRRNGNCGRSIYLRTLTRQQERFLTLNWPSRKLSDPYSMRTSGLIEVGAYYINNLRRSPKVEFHCWKPILGIPKPKSEPKKPHPEGMEQARYYQLLLDSGEVETRAELAHHLGVSRARVTRVLNRLKSG